MKRTVISEKQSEEIKQLRINGMSKRELANKFNCSETTINNHIRGSKSLYTGARGVRLTEEQIKEMKKLRREEKTLEFIAIKFKCSISSVKLHTKEIKVERDGKIAIKVREMLRSGKSVQETAAILVCNRDYVYRISMAMDKNVKSAKNEQPPHERIEEIKKQKQLLKEKQQKRKIELEELRQQEIMNFRWGGTVKIC